MTLCSIVKGVFVRYVRLKHLQCLHAAVERVLRRRIDGTVTIVCVNDLTMRTLNRRYRKKDKTTDVLSFLYAERRVLQTHTIVGDILLATPEVRRQSRERMLPVQAVTDELIVHGFLHLVGYDHEQSKKDEKMMFGLQEKILHYVFDHADHS